MVNISPTEMVFVQFIIQTVISSSPLYKYQLTKLHQRNQQKQLLDWMPSVVLREILTF